LHFEVGLLLCLLALLQLGLLDRLIRVRLIRVRRLGFLPRPSQLFLTTLLVARKRAGDKGVLERKGRI
jgi:hypothetical protein